MTMRFMVLVKATKASEAGVMPSKELIDAMGTFNEELASAGMLLAGEGLQPSSKGARITFSGGTPQVKDGPFPATGELVAGFWMVQAKSKAEIIEWFKRCPPPAGGGEGDIEIRQVFEASDFPPEILSPEAAAREETLRKDEQARAKR
jgi:hypothetical protein